MKIPFHNSLSAICSWVTKSEFLTLMPLKGYNNYHVDLKGNLLIMTKITCIFTEFLGFSFEKEGIVAEL